MDGRVTAADIMSMNLPVQVVTLAGIKVIADKNNMSVKINAATVASADVAASNGVIHVIGNVLLPPTNIVQTATDDENLETFVAALNATDLDSTLNSFGPFTVFAPSTMAFNLLPIGVVDELLKPRSRSFLRRILRYHATDQLVTASSIRRMDWSAGLPMLAGGTSIFSEFDGTLRINGARISTPDVFNTNGVIHIIDNVILPPLDIIETAIMNGIFKTLIDAIATTDLPSILGGPGPFTLFAPTDAAFAKLPAGVLADLLKPENKNKLVSILTYHVCLGALSSGDINNMALPVDIVTLAGGRARLGRKGSSITINGAEVLATDVLTTNGVFHIIDTVLMPPLDLVQTAIADGNFTTLVAALRAVNYTSMLQGDAPFTLFAPTDDAFAKLPSRVLADLFKPENKEELKILVNLHILSGRVASSGIMAMALPAYLSTIGTIQPIVDRDGATIKINTANVAASDVEAVNGIIHVLDTVLMPLTDIVQTAINNGSFNTLVTALTAAGLVDALQGTGPFTVFAPTDTAFAKLSNETLYKLLEAENKNLLNKILQYHVTSRLVTGSLINRLPVPADITMLASGTATLSAYASVVMINHASVIAADVFNRNGMIHVIDNVILPPLDIVETALMNGNFHTLIALLKAADLSAVLQGSGPFTVFAPTDAAFAKLPAGVLADLIKPENKETLSDLLKYHVVACQKILLADLQKLETIGMFAGESTTVTLNGANFKINEATIVMGDGTTTNGVIHVLDSVLTMKTTH